MKFTPFSIKNQEFSRSVRGYDKDEVRAYLEKLSDEVESLQAENTSLSKKIEKMNSEIDEFKKIEKNLQSTLLSAQESSSKAVESAKKQTALLLRESELKAQQIVEEAKENANMIRNSVLKLREEKNLLVAKLKAMLETQNKLLQMSFKEFKEMKDEEVEEQSESLTGGKEETQKSQIDVDDILEKLL